jgi:hypothetical protein
MQKQHELPSVQQLELDFELTNIAVADVSTVKEGNVIKVTFGKSKKFSTSAEEKEEQVFIDRIVESARRLSW